MSGGDTSANRNSTALSLMVVGALLVALSVVWAQVDSGRSVPWTTEKARAYQAASAKVHGLTVKMGNTAPEEQSRALHEELADAQAAYSELREDLDAARDRPHRIATMLRYVGIALAIVGGLVLLAGRAKAEV